MFFLFLDQWNSEDLLRAVCWTFVHSIWQGVATAILGGFIIVVTKKTKAHLRYNLLLLLFGLFLFLVAITFIKELSNHSGKEALLSTLQITPTVPVSFNKTTSYNREKQESFTATVVAYFNEHAPVIVLLWLIFFVVHCVQLRSGLSYMQRLKKSATAPSWEWEELLKILGEKIGLNQSVVLKESPLVNVPLTFGYLKATILVPLGLLSNLPLDQVEAVLLHELAHIRRKDYLVNLLQSIADTIFFFNPGLLWLSSLIRREREACCDDIVLLHMPQKQTYLEALVSFQEYSLVHPASVIALTYKKGYLLHRIKRMLTKENQKLNVMEKTWLLFGIIAITAFGFVSKTKVPIASPAPVHTIMAKPINNKEKGIRSASFDNVPSQQKKIKQLSPVFAVKKDTVPSVQKKNITGKKIFSSVSTKTNDDGKTKTYETEATDNEGKKYRIKKVNDAVTEFMVDGKKVDPASGDYAEILDQFEKMEIEHKQRVKEHEERMKEHEARMKEHQDKLKEHEIRLKEHQENLREQQEKREVFSRKQEEWQKQQKLQRVELEKNMTLMKMNLEQHQKLQKTQTLQKQEFLKKQKAFTLNKNGLAINGEINSIINDLTKNNIIINPDALSFSLNSNELIVNGKKQPNDLHQSLKERYIKKQGDRFNYSKNGGSTSITINKE